MNETFHPQKGPYLRSLTPGDHFVGFFTLRSKQLEPYRDPSRGYFLTLILSDRSGQLLARVWENAELYYEELPQGQVVKVEGEVELYMDRTQIIVLRARVAEPDEYDLRDLIPSSKRDPQEMLAELQGFINQITNPHLRTLIDLFFNQPALIETYTQAPAARRIHHAYLGGLMEHTLAVLHISQTIARIYPTIDHDLLLTGALLNSLGKLREFTWELDIDYTDEGRLLGHIIITDEIMTSALNSLPEFPQELALRLRHMLLAHHGKLEWGSPQTPKTLEAIALHHIDNLDAQLNRFQGLLAGRPEGEVWTAYDRLLGRQLYGGLESSLT